MNEQIPPMSRATAWIRLLMIAGVLITGILLALGAWMRQSYPLGTFWMQEKEVTTIPIADLDAFEESLGLGQTTRREVITALGPPVDSLTHRGLEILEYTTTAGVRREKRFLGLISAGSSSHSKTSTVGIAIRDGVVVMSTTRESDDPKILKAFQEGWMRLLEDDLKAIEGKIEAETPKE